MRAETSVSGLFRIASSQVSASGETIPPILSQLYLETQLLEEGGPWEMKQSHLLILEVGTSGDLAPSHRDAGSLSLLFL